MNDVYTKLLNYIVNSGYRGIEVDLHSKVFDSDIKLEILITHINNIPIYGDSDVRQILLSQKKR